MGVSPDHAAENPMGSTGRQGRNQPRIKSNGEHRPPGPQPAPKQHTGEHRPPGPQPAPQKIQWGAPAARAATSPEAAYRGTPAARAATNPEESCSMARTVHTTPLRGHADHTTQLPLSRPFN
eukprot:gene11463-biopygen22889